MSLESVIAGAGTVVEDAITAGTLSGIRKVFTEAPDALNELPAVQILPDDGDLVYPRKSGLREIKHHLKLLLYVVSGGSLAEAETLLRPYVQKVIGVFDQHITLGGAAMSSGITRYEYGILSYAGVDYLGITFSLTVEENQPTVFQA